MVHLLLLVGLQWALVFRSNRVILSFNLEVYQISNLGMYPDEYICLLVEDTFVYFIDGLGFYFYFEYVKIYYK